MKTMLLLFVLILFSCELKDDFYPFNDEHTTVYVSDIAQFVFTQSSKRTITTNSVSITNISGKKFVDFDVLITLFLDEQKSQVFSKTRLNQAELNAGASLTANLDPRWDRPFSSSLIQVEVLNLIEGGFGGIYEGEFRLNANSLDSRGLAKGIIDYHQKIALALDSDSISGLVSGDGTFSGKLWIDEMEYSASGKEFFKSIQSGDSLKIGFNTSDTLYLKLMKL